MRWMQKLRIGSFGLGVLLALGCQSVPPLNTPAGRPMVFIEGAKKPDVMEATVAEAMNNGYVVAEQTDFSLLLVKDADDFGSQFLFGSQFNRTPQKQFRCSLAETDGGVKLTGAFAIVTNPGSSFAKSTNLTTGSQAAHDIQDLFQRVRSQVLARHSRAAAISGTRSESDSAAAAE